MPGLGHKRRRIFTHGGREAFHDYDCRAYFRKPCGDRSHRGIVGLKGMMDPDEYQTLSAVLVAGDKWNGYVAIAWAPGLCPSFQFQ